MAVDATMIIPDTRVLLCVLPPQPALRPDDLTSQAGRVTCDEDVTTYKTRLERARCRGGGKEFRHSLRRLWSASGLPAELSGNCRCDRVSTGRAAGTRT